MLDFAEILGTQASPSELFRLSFVCDKPRFIHTVPGTGYFFEAEEAA